MELIEVNINFRRPDVFHFYPIGDIHGGCVECAENEIKRKVNEIANRKNSYAIGHGDYTECITTKDPRFNSNGLAPWVGKSNIAESQRKWITDKKTGLFRPLAEEGKLICMLTGNHEEEIHKRHDNDITRNMCSDLDVPYGGYACYILLKFFRAKKPVRTYIWHAWHGAGSAQTEGARLMRLMRLVNDVQADIYTMGHLHGAITTHTPDRLVYRGGKIKSVQLIASLSGSWLKAYMQGTKARPLDPHYSEIKGYKPARIGCPIIHIEPDEDRVTIEV